MSGYTEINNENLREMVADFYHKCRIHPQLAPVFEKYVGVEDAAWDEHIETVSKFWGAMINGEKGYKGNPMKVHDMITEMRPEHFDMWMYTFQDSAMALYNKECADKLIRASESMNVTMQSALKRGGNPAFANYKMPRGR